MGYIAALPSQPQSAFSVRLLVHHHTIWLRCAVSTEGFINGVDSVLDYHNQAMCTAHMQVSLLARAKASDHYAYVLGLSHSLESGVSHSQWLLMLIVPLTLKFSA